MARNRWIWFFNRDAICGREKLNTKPLQTHLLLRIFSMCRWSCDLWFACVQNTTFHNIMRIFGNTYICSLRHKSIRMQFKTLHETKRNDWDNKIVYMCTEDLWVYFTTHQKYKSVSHRQTTLIHVKIPYKCMSVCLCVGLSRVELTQMWRDR